MAVSAQPVFERESYLSHSHGILSWLLTTDHKRVAILYLISTTAMFFVGDFLLS
jgi:cytochrome c oxidase subunit 1